MCPFSEGGLGPHMTQSPGPRRASVLTGTLVHPATIEMGRKFRGPAPIWENQLVPVTQSYLGRGLPPYQVASEVVQPFGHNRHGPKIGGCANSGDGSWVPIQHNVAGAEAYLHARFYLDPSKRLATIHQRYRQDRQNR